MKTMIVGGGLSGLALADSLERAGHGYLLLEARDRFGGRILSDRFGGASFDLGPTWFWPGQPRIAALIDRLGLEAFEQYATGDMTFEDERGRVGRGAGFASMAGSWRIAGGLGAVTQKLAEGLPASRKRLGARVTALSRTDGGVNAALSTGEVLNAAEVVLALPPRLCAEIAFTPPLPAEALRKMNEVATWMAGQAKAVALYDAPFWRDAGLSGDATSRCGPMVEIHDASPANGGPYALFGFIGVPPAAHADERILREQVKVQFGRLFGPAASAPAALFLKDWASDPLTSTEADKEPLFTHPAYGTPREIVGLWDDRMRFAGTEVAPMFGGYVEGALEAAENVLNAKKR
ncbi:MAG: NAD(P)/FAD-dependent oxidoreductase [Pseudomonadota bacterium]